METKTVLINGRTSDIHIAAAEKFIREGCCVILCGVNEAETDPAAAEKLKATGQAELIYTDFADEESCRRTVEQIVEKYGRIDVLLNAYRESKTCTPVTEADPAQFRRAVEMNLFGAIHMSYYVGQQMAARQAGTMINVSSAGGLLATGSDMGFHATMSALNLVTKTVSKAMAAQHVRVVCVVPDPLLENEVYAKSDDGIRKCRDLANLIWFLCTPESAALNASTVIADNGFTSWR